MGFRDLLSYVMNIHGRSIHLAFIGVFMISVAGAGVIADSAACDALFATGALLMANAIGRYSGTVHMLSKTEELLARANEVIERQDAEIARLLNDDE